MKKILLIILTFIIPVFGICQTSKSKMVKAKALIKTYMKTNMNDYLNYVPISYSYIDSLFTSPEEDEKIQQAYKNAIEAKEKAGLSNMDISLNVKPLIDKMESNKDMYGSQAILDCKSYSVYRDLYYNMIDNFHPNFIGWKIEHKFRAKNGYNATIIYETEFKFDKSISKIIGIDNLKK